MSWKIPLHAPWLGEEDAESVFQAVKEGWISSASPSVNAFESVMSQYFEGREVVAVNSGTAALYLALRAVGVVAGDWVLVPDLTFVAAVQAVKMLGATPILVDTPHQALHMDPDLVEDFLFGCENKAEGVFWQGKRVSAMLVVHVMGIPADMELLLSLSEKYQVPMVEDAAEALGSFWKEKPMGTLGEMGCLSFNGNKIISTGGGGAVIGGAGQSLQNVRSWSVQAKAGEAEIAELFPEMGASAGLGHYVHTDMGFNFRMTGIAASLGISQWSQLENALERKMQWSDLYFEALEPAGVKFPKMPEHALWNSWLNTVFVPDRDITLRALKEKGIEARPIWMPMHQLPFLQNCPNIGGGQQAMLNFDHGISLPSGPGLEVEEVLEVIAVVKSTL